MNKIRYVNVIYCDDVRNEVGNKTSLMGIYRNNLYVKDFPIMLSKFCVVIDAYTTHNNPFENVTFKVMRDDDVIATKSFENVIKKQRTIVDNYGEKAIEDVDGLLSASGVLTLSPFLIEGPCKLRIRVETEDEQDLKGQALVIEKLDE